MDLLTIKETAEILRVSPITVRRYIASGKLAAERVGRGIRVRREAIEEFVTPVEPRVNGQDAFYWPHKPANHADEDLVEICSRSSPSGVMWILIDRLDEYLDEHVPVEDDPLQSIIGLASSNGAIDAVDIEGEPVPEVNLESGIDTRGDAEGEGPEKLPTVLEALGVSAGIFRTGQPTNIAEHKDEYLAEAFEFKG